MAELLIYPLDPFAHVWPSERLASLVKGFQNKLDGYISKYDSFQENIVTFYETEPLAWGISRKSFQWSLLLTWVSFRDMDK